MFTVVLPDGTRHHLECKDYSTRIFSLTGVSPKNQSLTIDGSEVEPCNGDVCQLVRRRVDNDFYSAIFLDNVDALKLLIEVDDYPKFPVFSEEVAEVLASVVQPFSIHSIDEFNFGAHYEIMSEGEDIGRYLSAITYLDFSLSVVERSKQVHTTRLVLSSHHFKHEQNDIFETIELCGESRLTKSRSQSCKNEIHSSWRV